MNELLKPHILALILGSLMAAVFFLCGDTRVGLLALIASLITAFALIILLYVIDE